MKLQDWLRQERIARKDFADRIGCSQAYLSQSLRSVAGFSQRIAERIQAETANAVTVAELRRQPWSKARPRECKPLADYLRDNQLLPADIIAKSGISAKTVYGLLNGHAVSDATKWRVSYATGSAVTPAQLIAPDQDGEIWQSMPKEDIDR